MLPDDKVGTDEFLMNDSPDVPPGVSDPNYVPLSDGFEPWAMEYEKFDRLSGFGLNQCDELGCEPWSMAYFTQRIDPVQSAQGEPIQDSLCPMTHHALQSSSSSIFQDEFDTGGHIHTSDEAYSLQPQSSDFDIDICQDMEPWAAHLYATHRPTDNCPPQDRPTEQCIEPWAARYYRCVRTSSQSCATPVSEPAQPEGFEAMFSFARDASIPLLGCFPSFNLQSFRRWWFGSQTSAICGSNLKNRSRRTQGFWPFQWALLPSMQTSGKPVGNWYAGTCHHEMKCPTVYEILYATPSRPTIQPPSSRGRIPINFSYRPTMPSLAQIIRRFANIPFGWLSLVQSNTERQSSIGIPDNFCHPVATSTDIDHHQNRNLALYSSESSYTMTFDIEQSNNIQGSADVTLTWSLESSPPFQAGESTCSQEHFGGHFVCRLQRPPQNTISSGAVPDPTAMIQELQHLTIYHGAVPGSNLAIPDDAVSMFFGFGQLPYRLIEHRSQYLHNFGRRVLFLPTYDVFHRDMHLLCNTDFDSAVIQCPADDFILHLMVSRSTGPRDIYASEESTSSCFEALSQHQYGFSFSHDVSSWASGACDLCNFSQVLLRFASFTGAVPDPTVTDPGQRQFTISRGAVPVSNSDEMQTSRAAQTMGEQTFVLAKQLGDVDLREELFWSYFEDCDISFRLELGYFLVRHTIQSSFQTRTTMECIKNHYKTLSPVGLDPITTAYDFFLIWLRADLSNEAFSKNIQMASQLWHSVYPPIRRCHLICKQHAPAILPRSWTIMKQQRYRFQPSIVIVSINVAHLKGVVAIGDVYQDIRIMMLYIFCQENHSFPAVPTLTLTHFKSWNP